MTVSVVVPTWNRRDLLEQVLLNLREQTLPIEEVIVVDNGSHDGSAELGRRLGATVIEFDSNRGFAAAVNAGVNAAQTEAVAVINNDVRLQPAYLELLQPALEQGAFACGKLLSTSRPAEIEGTFDALSRGATAWRCGSGKPDGPLWSEPRTIQFAPFTALLLSRSYFLAVGGLDDRFESYLEDVDFGLRCASMGYTGCYVPDAVAWHEGNSTLGRWSPTTVRYISRNQLLILARHYPSTLLLRFGWPIAVAQLLWGLVALRHGAGLAWLAGKADGLLMWTSIRRNGAHELASVLDLSEQTIHDLQKRSGYDWYWRIYFALT